MTITDDATELRFCKDCRFSHTAAEQDGSVANLVRTRWTCTHPTSLFDPGWNLVTGKRHEPYQVECYWARQPFRDDMCGQIGRHWQAR